MMFNPRDRAFGPNGHLVGVPGSRWMLDTPALVLERPAFEHNLAKMAEIASRRGLALRPHAKTHKCAAIAKRQIAAGAIGVSCTILKEAEAMAAAGIDGVLITSPVVTPAHIARLMALARQAAGDIMVVADHPGNVAALSRAAAGLSRPLGVLVDFSAGYRRTGTANVQAAVDLAKIIATAPNLVLRGLQAYAGNIQHIEDRDQRAARAGALRDKVSEILAGAASVGLPLPIVTGAGTGTHDLDGAPFTELQPGSYLFGDAQYSPVLRNGTGVLPFQVALFMQASVVSTNAPDYVTIDAGVKSFATDGPLPLPARGAPAGSIYAFFGDEHGRLFVPGDLRPVPGAKIELMTPHCDPTVNLHDWLHLVDGADLVDVWPVDARGH